MRSASTFATGSPRFLRTELVSVTTFMGGPTTLGGYGFLLSRIHRCKAPLFLALHSVLGFCLGSLLIRYHGELPSNVSMKGLVFQTEVSSPHFTIHTRAFC